MNSEMKFMTERYPGFRDKILTAYRASEDFRALCDDFYSSAKTLEQCKEKVKKDMQDEQEYQRLMKELEDELLRFLSPDEK